MIKEKKKEKKCIQKNVEKWTWIFDKLNFLSHGFREIKGFFVAEIRKPWAGCVCEWTVIYTSIKIKKSGDLMWW